MRAVVYQGPHEVAVNEVEDPRIEHPDDVVVQITTTAICGSDLHMYEGRTLAEPGIVFGHENMGTVVEAGTGVRGIKVGDRVSMPFNVGCGFCRNCREQKTGFCLTVNPGFAGGAYGYVAMGPYRGGQAEYLRVPFADFNCLKLPPGTEHENDYAMLADIFPTGYHGVAMTGLRPGERITVMGGGPVGLMAAYSAVLMGAAEVFLVDRVPDRLRLAESIGATPIDFSAGDPVAQILDRTDGVGTDHGVDAVGYQATGAGGAEQPASVLNSLVEVVRATGAIGVVGLYLAHDPGAPDEHSGKGELLFKMGKLFEKGLRMGTGQANVKTYNEYLRNLIMAGRATPGFVVSKELPLDAAPDAYQRFDRREEGYSKVVLKPAA
ncbi:glutathione-independent formaldehyde dehydrogenase [Micromonospora matsumotoense]|uniref:Glutathione-independent formaldehyde dehydrogenase n=1 Tax=Micromonospora matsumotoense TaxID=121616 RepID=A0A1C4XX57_9ACTN|nr:glutathione-independent formaldehyde dehydrogenase [Micromonospora matsumotoense]SCF13054.1 glutathione-independent formaldehyde dehydrogenase [Micromonospora matsumotoense]